MAAADETDELEDPLSYWTIRGEGTAQTETAIGRRAMLYQWPIEELARKSGYGTHSWCAISPPDLGVISPVLEERCETGALLLSMGAEKGNL